MIYEIKDIQQNLYFQNNNELFLELFEFVKANPFGYHKLILNNKRFIDWIDQITPKLKSDRYKISTKCNWIFHNISEFPVCSHCHKQFDMNITVWKDYPKMCKTCNVLYNNELKQKRRMTFAKHVENNPDFIKEIREKANNTLIEKYGSASYNNTEKARKTRLQKFNGSWSPADFYEKCVKTKLAGGHPADWNNIEKIKETNLKRYNVENVFSSKQIKEKIRRTNVERHGVENVGESENIKQKIKKTNLEKLGVENPFQSDTVKDKIQQTNIRRYGVNYPMQNKEICDKAKSKYIMVCMKKYGQPTYFSSDEFKLQCRQKFGVDNPMQNSDIQKSAKRKYTFKKYFFDSAAELAFYIWLTDNGIDFQYKPDLKFEYTFNNKKHYYFPDFIVNGQTVEIKGDQFFKEDGTMQNPFDNSMNDLYEAKHQCMLMNNVKIIRQSEYKQYIKYINHKYGHDYLKRFKL